MDIYVIEFYGYMKNIHKISVEIFTKISIKRKLKKKKVLVILSKINKKMTKKKCKIHILELFS